jgi:hypothetical protein
MMSPQEVAAAIRADWTTVHPYAEPYVEQLEQVRGGWDGKLRYGTEVRSVGLYLLGNLSRWKGEEARRVKAELKKAVNGK